MTMSARLLFWIIILLNLGGAAYGIFVFYPAQLAASSPLLWIFIADCPVAALLFAAAFFFRAEPRPRLLRDLFGRVPDLSWLWSLAFATALKYGFWTVFVLLAYSQFYFTPQTETVSSALLVAHIFLMFETILLVGRVRFKEWHLIPILVWFLANDASDYLLGTHPPLPAESLAFMFPATVAMSFAFAMLTYLVLCRYSGEFSGQQRKWL